MSEPMDDQMGGDPNGMGGDVPPMDGQMGPDGMGGGEPPMNGDMPPMDNGGDMGQDEGGSEIDSLYGKLSGDQKNAARKYIESMINDDDDNDAYDSPDMPQMSGPNESRMIEGLKPSLNPRGRKDKKLRTSKDNLFPPFSPRYR